MQQMSLATKGINVHAEADVLLSRTRAGARGSRKGERRKTGATSALPKGWAGRSEFRDACYHLWCCPHQEEQSK